MWSKRTERNLKFIEAFFPWEVSPNQNTLGTGHYFLSGGGTFYVKKLFASCSWLKKVVCKAKGNFLKYTDISKF